MAFPLGKGAGLSFGHLRRLPGRKPILLPELLHNGENVLGRRQVFGTDAEQHPAPVHRGLP